MEKWNFSEDTDAIVRYSSFEAQQLGNSGISVEHLFLSMIDQDIPLLNRFFAAMDTDPQALKTTIERQLNDAEEQDRMRTSAPDGLPMYKHTERLLDLANLFAKKFRSATIEPEHLLLAILWKEDNSVNSLLAQNGITYKKAEQFLLRQNEAESPQDSSMADAEDDEEAEEESYTPPVSHENKGGYKKSGTPVLDAFGRDLSKLADENRLDPIIGREKELERIAQILSRRKKNNPILIGEPGVGKSAIAEGLAVRIKERKVPRILLGKRIVSLDIASMVAGTKYRGQFEERMKSVLAEMENNPEVILFIDEIHTIVGAGNSSGALDASNMFKPALARGELQCIGSTTLDEYRKNIETDGALERRFQKVLIEPTSPEETIEILQNIKEKYEDHHLVTYTDEAIKACVYLTQRYVSDRCLPDKAIDAMDEAGARVHIHNMDVPEEITRLEKRLEELSEQKKQAIRQQSYEEAAKFRDLSKTVEAELQERKKAWDEEIRKHRQIVDESVVADVVAMITGVPAKRISKEENNKLATMEEDIKAKVIGQDEAVQKICKAIRRNKTGLKDPNKPIATFIFLGPTGVGKTYLAKVLSDYLFDSADAMIRIDMSEYMEKFTVSRLVGAPPGYVGYEEGGQLTEKVRRKPYSIVLLDEIEKAHTDIYNLLLQVFDDGQLTDGLGRKVDFKNTILIMTSNVGSRQLTEFGTGVGFSTEARRESQNENSRKVVENAVRKQFAPEFLNRIDDIIVFNPLERESIHQIIENELIHVMKRLADMHIRLQLTEESKNFLVDNGWNAQYGARPLKRAIQRYVEDLLSDEIINGSIHEGDNLELIVNEEGSALLLRKLPAGEDTGDAPCA
ncbi:MAG: ATP-dependent Clp protease ATP-binding subunit [Bacteroidales bacterium]|nr:ATP-dependent Clp protease ATP-binding subunit [Bacteroidales bacterium]